VQLQLGGFYMKYQDMQFSGFNATNPAAAAVTNIGASKIDGLEFSSQARLGRFDTRIDVAYLHSVLGNITQIASYRLPPNAVVPQCTPGQTAGCFDYTPYQTSLNGESNPYSPKLTASIDVDYRIPLGQDILRPRLSYSYTGSQYAALFQADNYYLMPAHGLWDASLAYEADKWLVQSYVNNFTNKVYYAGIGSITGGAGGSTVFYGAPRQYGLRVSRSF